MDEIVIWKYELNLHGITIIQMPIGAEILCVQLQYEKPTIWAIIDRRIMTESRSFEMFTTGAVYFDKRKKYIGTIQLVDGYVAHLFERL